MDLSSLTPAQTEEAESSLGAERAHGGPVITARDASCGGERRKICNHDDQGEGHRWALRRGSVGNTASMTDMETD